MLTVEKIEGTIVRVENGMQFTEVNLSLFDGDISEGDVVVMDENGRYRKDADATNERRKEILALQNDLWE